MSQAVMALHSLLLRAHGGDPDAVEELCARYGPRLRRWARGRLRHPSLESSILEQTVGGELLDRYETALLRLSPEDRDAIIARVELGLSWSEVASELGKNSDESAQMAVKQALVRLALGMSHERV
jgi:DNA-directed RNA polymerase specialized sigma24 family protein